MSVEEYLAFERAAAERHEFIAGEVYAMAGVSNNHMRIGLSLGSELRFKLKGGAYEAFANDLKVFAASRNSFFYPDMTIDCGEGQYLDPSQHVLLNPVAVFEILSPSTEAFDRGKKFEAYRSLESLNTFVLVSQDSHLVEVYEKHGENDWRLRSFTEGAVELTRLGISVSMTELYDRVVFDTLE